MTDERDSKATEHEMLAAFASKAIRTFERTAETWELLASLTSCASTRNLALGMSITIKRHSLQMRQSLEAIAHDTGASLTPQNTASPDQQGDGAPGGKLSAPLKGDSASLDVISCADRDAFLAFAGECVEAGVKLKKAMQLCGLKRARAICPRCGGTLRGSINGPREHLYMACETPHCLRMME